LNRFLHWARNIFLEKFRNCSTSNECASVRSGLTFSPSRDRDWQKSIPGSEIDFLTHLLVWWCQQRDRGATGVTVWNCLLHVRLSKTIWSKISQSNFQKTQIFWEQKMKICQT
jgi:hypothetical protein